MATFAELAREIHGEDIRMAPGSETEILGHFVARMSALGGERWRESDAHVDDEEAAWWRRACELYEADRRRPDGERAETVQEIFDRV